MKRTIEIAASFTGKISTGAYENESPFFSVKDVMEMDEADYIADEQIKSRQQELYKICHDQFKHHAEISNAERIAKEYKNLRFYEGQNGVKYPSVTSIIGWDEDFYVSEDALAQYAARGTIIDKQVEIFLLTGEWKEPKDIPEIYPELVILKQGNLGLTFDDVDFRAFYEAYPFKVISCQGVVLNHQHRYGGRMDIKAIIESTNKGKWDKVEGVIFDVPIILDIKSGSIDKTKHLKQQTAYLHCQDNNDVAAVGLIPLNKETQQGFSKPIMESNKEKYWHLFIKDRENFKKRFGI